MNSGALKFNKSPAGEKMTSPISQPFLTLPVLSILVTNTSKPLLGPLNADQKMKKYFQRTHLRKCKFIYYDIAHTEFHAQTPKIKI